MIAAGTRVRVTQIWDPDAVDEAVGRRVGHGELGTVVDVDADVSPEGSYETYLVKFDNGGTCYLNRGEVTRTQD